MPAARFAHSFTVDAPREFVADHLATPESYVGLSPLVVEVRGVSPRGDRYTAVERVPLLGPLHWDNLIRVSLERHDEGASTIVGGHVDSPGGVTLDYRYVLTDAADGCAVVDEIELHAPFGLTRFAASRARTVQLTRARVLAERLER